MDFSLSAEQDALREVARTRLADPTPPSWAELVALGWLDPDLDPVDVAVLAEAVGHARGTDAWLLTQALAWSACRAAGRPLEQPATLAWSEPGPGSTRMDAPLTAIACRAEPDRSDAVRLWGRKSRVPYAAGITHALVLAYGSGVPGLYWLDLATLLEPTSIRSTVDADRPYLELDLNGTPGEPLLTGAATAGTLRQTRARTLTLLACEAVGLARAALDSAAAHARERVQFGRPIGAYQAVSHRLVEVYAAIELAASLAYRAAWCLGAGKADIDEAVTTATVAAREAALSACEVEVQTLGAAGFTWEHPAAGRYRRARWTACFEATTSEHRAALAAAVLDGGP